MKLCKTFFVLVFSLFALSALSQIPSDLSRVRASQISDAQLQQMVQQARARGLKPEEVEAELLQRGMPSSEVNELKFRIQELGLDREINADTAATYRPGGQRKLNEQVRPGSREDWFRKKDTRIFGSELFSNENLSFEPNLRMATPAGYVIGPEDELLLNIYGLNISQQTLKVTPEGSVNIKYAGVVGVAGMTIESATQLLRTRLSKYYPGLQNGQTKLQLSLGNIRSIRVVLIGAIERPGTYTLPSLASLFNALYVSGGPAENGSFRNIELIRNNNVILKADLYDFLTKGLQQANVRLEDNDVIRVPFAKNLVTLDGQVNRPGIFEVQSSEHLSDIIEFAGGFRSKAFRGRITGKRYADLDRQVLDVPVDSFGLFSLRNGDEFIVDSLISRYQNRVVISGAVFKAGPYALEQGMTIKVLIEKAQGLREDVFAGRAILVRKRPDLTKEYVNLDLKPILAGEAQGSFLRKDDSVHVASIFDLIDSTTVSINGAVRSPGIFRYEDSLSLKALILKAGGFAQNATGAGIEISRRKRDIRINQPGTPIVELIKVDDDMDLAGAANDLVLQPFDIITIKENPFYRRQISVKISGEVLMPAVYTLQSREERLSSLIKRSGGLLYTADIRGAKLVRQVKEEIDSSQVKRLLMTLRKDTASTQDSAVVKRTRDVAIDLDFILKHPGSEDDITLEDNDELVVPRINNTVGIDGEVYKPLSIMYEKGKSMRDYISDAGGVTLMGKRSRAFVIYANGSSAKIERPLGIFRKYPKITPGSNIYVPQKPKRDGADLARAGIIISAVTALLTAAALIIR